jgi:hypothetical protein
MKLPVVAALFTLPAVLGPWLGADSRVSGGWTPTQPGGKIWPDPPRTPDRESRTVVTAPLS